MRDEILRIVYDPKAGFNECADELTALMCYREVRAIFEYLGHYYIKIPSVFNAVFNQLALEYPRPLVAASLEKYKNEQE